MCDPRCLERKSWCNPPCSVSPRVAVAPKKESSCDLLYSERVSCGPACLLLLQQNLTAEDLLSGLSRSLDDVASQNLRHKPQSHFVSIAKDSIRSVEDERVTVDVAFLERFALVDELDTPVTDLDGHLRPHMECTAHQAEKVIVLVGGSPVHKVTDGLVENPRLLLDKRFQAHSKVRSLLNFLDFIADSNLLLVFSA